MAPLNLPVIIILIIINEEEDEEEKKKWKIMFSTHEKNVPLNARFIYKAN